MGERIIDLPWGAWTDNEGAMPLSVPGTWNAEVLSMRGAPAISAEQIGEAFASPIGCERIADLAAGKERVAVAVDDMSRPTQLGPIIRHLLDELSAAGVSSEKITIVISLGSHGAPAEVDLRRKLGEWVVDRFRIVSHDCRGELSASGVLLGKSEVRFNADFLAADLRLLVGSVIPHPFAGFSGGAKLLLPGLSNLDSIAWTHKAVLMGLRGRPGTLENNRFRAEIERVAEQVGIDATVNVVINQRREIAGVFVGDLVAAHRAAADMAAEVVHTKRAMELDVLVLNAYPKDTELLQAENAFMYFHTSEGRAVKENGTIVICSACSKGMGEHGLFQPGGALYRMPGQKRFLKERHLAFFSPGIDAATFHELYWEGYDHFSSWSEVVSLIGERHGESPAVGIVPHGCLQLARG